MSSVTIKNLTNSPYDLPLKGGGVARLGAMGGTVSGDFEPFMLDALRHSRCVEVLEDDAPHQDEFGAAIPAQGGYVPGLTAEEQAALDAANAGAMAPLGPIGLTGEPGPIGVPGEVPLIPTPPNEGQGPVAEINGAPVAIPPVPEPSPMVVALRAGAAALGIAYEPDWNEAKLQEELAKWQETHSS